MQPPNHLSVTDVKMIVILSEAKDLRIPLANRIDLSLRPG
jgi:hypothetical protein